MNRSDLAFLIKASFSANRPDYAYLLARAWLSAWTNDIGMRYFLAQACNPAKPAELGYANNLLDSVVAVDIEHAAAYRLLGERQPHKRVAAYAAAHIIDGATLPPDIAPPAWAADARRAVIAIDAAEFSEARRLARAALQHNGVPAVVSLTLLKSHWLAKEYQLALPLAEGFHERWPKSVAIMICLAECLLQTGQTHRAVELLHTASALDPAAEVVSRYWGRSHPYSKLWTSDGASVSLPAPVPADVLSLLGLNRLAGSSAQRPSASNKGVSHQSPQTASEALRDIQSQLTTLSAQLRDVRRHRRPVHVILHSPARMKAKFDPGTATAIIELIEELAAVTSKRRRVQVLTLAPEAPPPSLGLQPADPANAWAIKMLLHDLDRQLVRKGQAIGSLLIIGGDDLIPFHRLPNPTDDADMDVPSDNPYSTPDDNYFVPVWQVGRLPSPCGRSVEPLARALRFAITAHQQYTQPSQSWVSQLWRGVRRLLVRHGVPRSIGYSASVWKAASATVFSVLGSEKNLHTCPPLDTDSAPAVGNHVLTYFNLHGIENGPDWYGQRDPADLQEPLYPVAYSVDDVPPAKQLPPRVVFTEACYGANTLEKGEPQAALCLQFLDSGTTTLVGSTKISYGAIGSPLICADLLGRLFWDAVLGGLTAGEALNRAKLIMAHTVQLRQGFLDGEDQKTLISFVLYGDPLLTPVSPNVAPKRMPKSPGAVEPIAMDYLPDSVAESLQPEAIAHIKSVLARHLPGADATSVRVARAPDTAARNSKNRGPVSHRVVTFAKTIEVNQQHVRAFAKVTVNPAGKVLKVAVSK